MSDQEKLEKIDRVINKFLETYLVSLKYPEFYKLLKRIKKIIKEGA